MPIGSDDGGTGPSFVPISFVPSVTDVVTAQGMVTFTLTAPPGVTNPPLSLSFYETKNQPVGPSSAEKAMVMHVIALTDPPTPSWNNNVATFTLDIDSSLISQLSSSQTLFTVVVQITGDASSMGICSLALDIA